MSGHNHDVASSYCPSQDWDRYCDGQEMPETCPICDAENCDEDGEPVCKEAEGFCSTKCRDEYMAGQQAQAEVAAAEYFAEQQLIAEHNAKCPQCKGKEKYCLHSSNPDNKED